MDLKLVLESILFSAQRALTPKELRDVLRTAAKTAAETEQEPELVKTCKDLVKTKEPELEELLESLAADHEAAGRSYRLTCVGGAWRFVSLPDYAPWLMALVGKKPRPPKLTPPTLETLAIVAYRQPLTRSQIEQIRGVSADGAMQKLLERGLVEQIGKADAPGRPGLYGTTPLFLDYFGLKDLQGLPDAPELLRIPVEHPEQLKTVEEELETAPDSEATPEVDDVDQLAGTEETPAEVASTESTEDATEQEPEPADEDTNRND